MSSLYVHIPYCASKCPYCDFYSQVGSQQQIDEYVELLDLNLTLLKRDNQPAEPFSTIFFGGGTPSILSTKQIDNILNSIELNFGIARDAEITLEANPGTVDVAKLRGYRQSGVNRLSLGIQSLNEQNLQLLGRIHSVNQALESVIAARRAGFDNLNLDLMFALPGQKLESLAQEISALLSLNPEHVSLYGLSYEEGTEFTARRKAGELQACGENLYVDHYQLLHEQLAAVGFEHYEISNFCRPGHRCRHNQIYWQRKYCLAIGVGGHSFMERGWGERWHIPAKLMHYKGTLLQDKDPAELLETYTQQGAMSEFVYLALRTSDGIDRHEFKRRFDRTVEEAFSVALKNTDKYLHLTNDNYTFGLNGWLLYDHLISHFL